MVQIVHGDTFAIKAHHQYVAGANYFDRGSIFFTTREGTSVPAASLKTGFILHINPSILNKRNDLDAVYELINDITPIDKEDFLL